MTGLEGFAIFALLILAAGSVVFVLLAWTIVFGFRATEAPRDRHDVLGLSGAAGAFKEEVRPLTVPPPFGGRRPPAPPTAQGRDLNR